jgi:outer membrane protein assembly factor BamB
MSHSYGPLTRLLYVFARDERRVFSKNSVRHVDDNEPPLNNSAPHTGARTQPPRPLYTGIFGAGGNLPEDTVAGNPRAAHFGTEESWGKVVAIDPLSADINWEHKVLTRPWSGVMSTAGGLVFGGTMEGVVFALDARTGERLWYFAGNDRVYASPMELLC